MDKGRHCTYLTHWGLVTEIWVNIGSDDGSWHQAINWTKKRKSEVWQVPMRGWARGVWCMKTNAFRTCGNHYGLNIQIRMWIDENYHPKYSGKRVNKLSCSLLGNHLSNDRKCFSSRVNDPGSKAGWAIVKVIIKRNQIVGDHEQSCQIDRGSTADIDHLLHQCGLDQVHHRPFCGGRNV